MNTKQLLRKKDTVVVKSDKYSRFDIGKHASVVHIIENARTAELICVMVDGDEKVKFFKGKDLEFLSRD